ncbi:unnamed protein product [Penicillium bialowiezense]
MARLNDGEQDTAVDTTEILSPQPFHPQSKGFLVSSLEPTDQLYQRDNTQMTTQEYEYNSSSSSARHSTSDVFGREMDDELEHMKSRASSRSSLSSVPASVLIHPVERMSQMPDMDVREKIAGYKLEESEADFGDFNQVPTGMRTIRQREAVFRKPSSMHTEDEADDDDYLTPPRRRAAIRSPGSSPMKRSPYYSPKPQKQPTPKKEAPLVLLHCTLLPPSIPVPGAAEPRNQDILEDELPPEYWKRWRRLQDRVGSGVLRDRGVLISHPEDLYDMLEERLLESLELQRPRLQNGHFVGREDNDISGDDFSDIDESETDGEQGDECPDCGGHVRHGDSNRKWEIRVFAANGLMRAGAWAAAWQDMEKVDVEVGLWLPSDVRRGLERRFAEEQMALVERDHTQSPRMHSPQMRMLPISSLVDGENQLLPEILQSPRQSHVRMVSDVGSFRSSVMPSRQSISGPPIERDHHDEHPTHKDNHEVALSTLCANYIRVLAADRRNMALVILSVLVAFLAFGYGHHKPLDSEIQPFPASSFETILPSVMPSMSVPRASQSLLDQTIETAVSIANVDPEPSVQAEADHSDPVQGSDGTKASVAESAKPTESSAQPETLETLQPEPVAADEESVDEESPESIPIDDHAELGDQEELAPLDALETPDLVDEPDEIEGTEEPEEVGPSEPVEPFESQSVDPDEPSNSHSSFESSDLPPEPTDVPSIFETEETHAEPEHPEATAEETLEETLEEVEEEVEQTE